MSIQWTSPPTGVRPTTISPGFDIRCDPPSRQNHPSTCSFPPPTRNLHHGYPERFLDDVRECIVSLMKATGKRFVECRNTDCVQPFPKNIAGHARRDIVSRPGSTKTRKGRNGGTAGPRPFGVRGSSLQFVARRHLPHARTRTGFCQRRLDRFPRRHYVTFKSRWARDRYCSLGNVGYGMIITHTRVWTLGSRIYKLCMINNAM